MLLIMNIAVCKLNMQQLKQINGGIMLSKEKNEMRLFLYGSIIAAIALGMYAQDIAYFLNRNLAVPLMAGISIPTVLSIFLFLGPPTLVSKFGRGNKMLKKEFNIYLVFNVLTGLVVSAFSLIVLIAWCG